MSNYWYEKDANSNEHILLLYCIEWKLSNYETTEAYEGHNIFFFKM
jgi:hypothetical protein